MVCRRIDLRGSNHPVWLACVRRDRRRAGSCNGGRAAGESTGPPGLPRSTMRLATTLVAFLLPLASAAAQAVIAQPWGLQPAARLIDFGAGMFPDATPITNQFAGVTFSHASYFT